MADLDGVVRIGTEIDDSGFKKGMQDLAKTADKSLSSTKKEFEKVEDSVEGLGKEVTNTKKDVDKFGDELDKTSKDAKGFSTNIDKASKGVSSFTSFLSAGLLTSGITMLVSGFASMVAESEEFTRGLSRLETSAADTGNSFDSIQENFKDFVALTNQADSSAEALSNLLQTGFDDAGITQAVEALSGAVVKFPDTLNIESLADGLQETLATGEATGQFGELLDRLGIGAENFSDALANTTTEAEKQQLVLQTLADAGLNELYEQYAEANSASLEFKEAQAELNMAMSNFVQGILPYVSEGFGVFAENVLSLSQAFREGGLSGLLEAAQTLIVNFVAKIQESTPQLLEAGLEIVSNLADGVVENLNTFIAIAPKILQEFVKYIEGNLNIIVQNGGEILKNLAKGITDAIPDLAAQLPTIIQTITAFVSNNLPTILKTGIDILMSLASGIIAAIPDLVAQLPAIISALVGFFISAMSSIAEVGKYIVEGIWQGISGAADWLLGKIKEWCGSILDGIKAFFGIHSPSTVMRDTVGKNLVQGVIEGVKALSDNLVKTLVAPVEEANKKINSVGLSKNMSNIIKDAQKKAQNEAKNYSEVGEILITSLQEGIDENKESMIESVQAVIDETIEQMDDEDQRAEAKEAATELMNSYKDALEKGAQEAKGYISDSISEITSEFQSQYDDLLSKQEALEDTLGGTYLFEVEDGEVFIEDVQQSIDTLNAYSDALQQLKDKGASAALLDEIARFEPEEGMAVIDKLLGMTDEDFEALNELWAEKRELAKEIAAEFYAEQMEQLKTEFVDEMMNTLEQVPLDTYDIGINTIQSWMNGMNSKLPDLLALASRLARGVISKMRDELGIASPSKEGIYMGKMINEGVAKGLTQSTGVVENSIQHLGFFDSVKAAIPQLQSMVASTMSNMMPSYAFAGGGTTRSETVRTINRNTVQTVKIEADSQGIFKLVQGENKRRGSSYIEGRGLA